MIPTHPRATTRRIRKTLGSIVLAAMLTVAGAEEIDQFSRANCFNNESIHYDFFSPPRQGSVISTHIDTQNGNDKHYVGHTRPVYCFGGLSNLCPSTCTPLMDCAWPILWGNRFAAIHNVEDGVPLPGLSTRWRVEGSHFHIFGWIQTTYIVYPIYILMKTNAVDCNFHFNQFY